jgi:hypothetical protein
MPGWSNVMTLKHARSPIEMVTPDLKTTVPADTVHVWILQFLPILIQFMIGSNSWPIRFQDFSMKSGSGTDWHLVVHTFYKTVFASDLGSQKGGSNK